LRLFGFAPEPVSDFDAQAFQASLASEPHLVAAALVVI
jgi:hypothetical protein